MNRYISYREATVGALRYGEIDQIVKYLRNILYVKWLYSRLCRFHQVCVPMNMQEIANNTSNQE